MKKTNLIIALLLVLMLGICLVACGEEDMPDGPISFTVTFDTQGGSEIAPITFTEGDEITLPEAPTRAGYIFDGWYIDRDLLNAFVENQTITGNITLYAKWICVHASVTDVAVDADCENTGLTEGAHCSKCGEVLVEQQIVPAGHKYGEWEKEASADCENAGIKGHYQCSECHKYFDAEYKEIADVTIQATGHEYGVVTYTWSDDNTTCTASRTCAHDASHVESKSATITSKVVQPASCTQVELSTITATFDVDWAQTQEKQDVQTAEMHVYADLSYNVCVYSEPVNKSVIFGLYQDNLGKWLFANGRFTEDYYFKTVEDFSSGLDVNIIHSGDELCQFSPEEGFFISLYSGSEKHVRFVVTSKSLGYWVWNSEYNTYTFECDRETYIICATGQSTVASPVKFSDFEQNPSEYFVLQAVYTTPSKWADEILASCENAGKKGHYECLECHKYFDAENNEIGDITIPANGHGYGEWKKEISATCVEVGIKGYYECSECHKYFDAEHNEIIDLIIAIDTNAHTYGTWREAVSETCTTNGIKGHFECGLCGKYFDADYNEITDLIIPATGHDTSAWIDEVPSTCISSGEVGHYYCSYCNQYIDAENNVLLDLSYYDENAHDYFWINETPATCSERGEKEHYICLLCGKYFDVDYNEITDLTIPSHHFDKDGVCEDCGYFETGLEISRYGAGWIVTGIGTFSGTDLKIPRSYEDGKPIIGIGDSAFKSTTITSVFIPCDMVSIGKQAFWECRSLKTVTFENNSKLETLSTSAFHDCSDLQSIELPSSVTEINAYAFAGCYALESIIVNGIVENWDSHIFYFCHNLKEITISAGVVKMSSSFIGCFELEKINYGGTIEEWNKIEFSYWDDNDAYGEIGNYTIYCTDGTIAKDGTISYYSE